MSKSNNTNINYSRHILKYIIFMVIIKYFYSIKFLYILVIVCVMDMYRCSYVGFLPNNNNTSSLLKFQKIIIV